MALCCLSLAFINVCSFSQNLVPNPSFEAYTECPTHPGPPPGPMVCPPWISIETADYYNECSSDIFHSIPINVQGYQLARTGAGYVGEHFFIGTYREYIQVQLTQTLVVDQCYKVGFYLNLGNISCGVNFAGALLTPNAVMNPLGMTPQVDWGGTYFSDTVNWIHVFDYFRANGTENYLTIGNFHNTGTSFDTLCDEPFIAYYFIEDVSVEAVTPEIFDIDLDGPVVACDSFLIEPEIDPILNEVLYEWSNGHIGPTLTVYTSGTYTVTATYACNIDVASIDVEITVVPPVEVGDDVTICPGEEHTVSLDPDAGTYEWQDGSNASDYTITEDGVYYVALDDGCELTYDTLAVTVLQPPSPFSLGVDTFICEGEELDIIFDPLLGDFQWQDGNSNSNYNINNDGTYSLTISNMCGSESDEIEVVEISPPFFNIGPSTQTLCSGEQIQIFLDPELGSFLWQDGSDSPDYTITNPGTYIVTVTNECGVESDQMIVNVITPPNVFLGPDTSLCGTDTLSLTAGTNVGNYLWQDGSTSDSFQVTTTGIYILSVTNFCGVDIDSISVGFNAPVVQPDLGPDLSLCPGQSVILSVNATGATVQWNDLSTADTLLVTSGGQYSVQVSNGCGAKMDTILITESAEPPVINLPFDYALCQGESDTLDANISNVVYQWNDMSTGSQLVIFAPGTYSLTVTNTCGSDADTVVIADGGLAPNITLGIDTSICEGTSFIASPDATNVSGWMWQNGSVDSFIIISNAGEYSVTASNSCGEAKDTMIVGLLPAIPAFSLGPDTTICPGNSITLSVNIPNVDIAWSNGSTLPAIVVADSSTIFASITNSCGTSSDSMEIHLLADIPALDLGADQSICPGETIIIEPSILNVDYLWQDGSSLPVINITQGGLITLTISNDCGMSVDSLMITESTDGPHLDLGPDRIACEGETVIIDADISGVNFTWQNGSTNSSFEATASGEYSLQVTNLCGTDSDTILVTISGVQPVTDLGMDTMLCEGNDLLLTTTSDPNTATTWQDGSTNQTFVVQSAGTYWVNQANHCGEDNDSIYVTFLPAPELFDLGKDTILCAGESITLTAPVTDFNLEWQDGSSGSQYLVNSTGTYSLQVYNDCGMQSDDIIIEFNDEMPFVDLGNDTLWCVGDVLILDASQLIPAHYVWNTNVTTPTISVTTPGTYEVKVMTTCFEVSDEIKVIADTNCSATNTIYIPDIFSPNDDGMNDVFTLSPSNGIEIISVDGSIFDRWGNIVFSSASIPFSWDGKFGDTEVMPGVYVYSIEIEYRVNGREIRDHLVGDVTVVK